MREYEIVDTNAENIGGCGFCGNMPACGAEAPTLRARNGAPPARRRPGRNPGHRRKCDWLKERYAEGLRFKVLRSQEFGDIGMIEYAPGNQAWRPVAAEGYLVIHCLMVNRQHQGQGLGRLLLESCLRDARKSQCRGVAVVTSSDAFMARRDLFIQAGFVPVMCCRFNGTPQVGTFRRNVRGGRTPLPCHLRTRGPRDPTSPLR